MLAKLIFVYFFMSLISCNESPSYSKEGQLPSKNINKSEYIKINYDYWEWNNPKRPKLAEEVELMLNNSWAENPTDNRPVLDYVSAWLGGENHRTAYEYYGKNVSLHFEQDPLKSYNLCKKRKQLPTDMDLEEFKTQIHEPVKGEYHMTRQFRYELAVDNDRVRGRVFHMRMSSF